MVSAARKRHREKEKHAAAAADPPATSTDERTEHRIKKDQKRKEKRRAAAEQKRQEAASVAPSGKAAPSAAVSAPAHRVFVGRLAQSTTEDELERHFAACGPVTCVDMLRRRETNRFKGAAFVVFETAAAVDAALLLDGSDVGGEAARCTGRAVRHVWPQWIQANRFPASPTSKAEPDLTLGPARGR